MWLSWRGAQHGRLDFEPPDLDAFPCLGLAFRALEAGGNATGVLNAANEIAVSAFLQGGIGFLSIPAVIEQVLEAASGIQATTLDDLLALDAHARRLAKQAVAKAAGGTHGG